MTPQAIKFSTHICRQVPSVTQVNVRKGDITCECVPAAQVPNVRFIDLLQGACGRPVG